MDPVEPSQNFNHFVVFSGLNRLADEQAVLGYCAPGYPRGMRWGNGGEGLIASKEGLKIKEAVCAAGTAGEV